MTALLWTRYMLALRFASVIHRGQRYGDEPYVHHCVRVAAHCGDADDRIIALLHDTIEDAGGKFARSTVLHAIRHQFGPSVAEAVQALTRGEAETYNAYIERIAYRESPVVLAVKMADVAINLRQIYADQKAGRNQEKWGLLVRYELSLAMLWKAQRQRIANVAWTEHPEKRLWLLALRGEPMPC